MGDSDSGVAGSKKRVAGRQISKDNPELDDDSPEPEMGTFQRASDEVLATRRIVKVRHSQTQAAGYNPFAAIHLVPPSTSSANLDNLSAQADTPGDKTEVKDGADDEHGESKEGKRSESEILVDKPNGIEESNKKAEEKTDVSTAKDDSKVESSVVEETSQLVETVKDAENGEKGTEEKAREETAEEDKEQTEKRPSGKETDSENAHEEKAEKGKLENDNKDADAAKPAASLSSFQQLSSSQNAFTGLAGTGFGSSSFSFGSIAKEGPTFGATSGSIFGSAVSNNGSFSWQPSATSAADVTKSGVPSMQEVPIETGEENEKAVFTADSILYEYLDGGWKERGKGELKLNVSISDAAKARLVMRARGNYRLILNASLYPDMTLTNMDKKGITFACINSSGEGKNGLSTFALKFKDSSFVEEFRGAVEAHKGKKTTVLKTPENSPKASED